MGLTITDVHILTYFTKEVKAGLVKPPLKFAGGLVKNLG